jgi:hypothetical protein
VDPFIKKWIKRITIVMVSITILFWVALGLAMFMYGGDKGPLLLYGIRFTLLAAFDIVIFSLLFVGFTWCFRTIKKNITK